MMNTIVNEKLVSFKELEKKISKNLFLCVRACQGNNSTNAGIL